LGEEERSQKMSVVTAFALGNQLTAPLIDAEEVLVQMYQDAGVKNAERFLNTEKVNPAQMMQQLQSAQQMLQKMGQELQKEKSHSATKMAKIQSDSQAKEHKLQVDHADRMTELRAEMDARRQELIAEITGSIQSLKKDMTLELIKESANHHREVMKMVSEHQNNKEKNQIVMDTSGASVKDTSKQIGELAKGIESLAKNQTALLEHIKKPRKVRSKRVNGVLEAEIS
jgi:Skp family chaperone for outer membrane proteins